jgi:N-succinyldiaminopimelate aminotransferase
VALLFVCSPGNPTGAVLSLTDWEHLFALSERYNFVIAADECYSEIYHGERRRWARWRPPTSWACHHRASVCLVVFSSLSKRSNVPGMRSGFVAGDAEVLKKFLLYRTYHGGAMSLAVQAASIAAWNDETHVEQNREQYRAKFNAITPLLKEVLDVELPDAGFYLWADVSRTGLSRHRIRPAPVRRI